MEPPYTIYRGPVEGVSSITNKQTEASDTPIQLLTRTSKLFGAVHIFLGSLCIAFNIYGFHFYEDNLMSIKKEFKRIKKNNEILF